MKLHVMKRWVFGCVVGVMGVCLSGCDFNIAGGPMPDVRAEEYLQTNDFRQSTIKGLLNYQKLPTNRVQELMQVPNENVLHMLAENPYLTREEREVFWQDKRWMVRYGVAHNLSLSREEMERALMQENQDVLNGLAANPAVPPDIMWALYKHPNNGYPRKRSFWARIFPAHPQNGPVYSGSFCQNPNCPETIVTQIMAQVIQDGIWVDLYQRTLKTRAETLEIAAKNKGESIPDGGYYRGQIHLWWRGDKGDGAQTNAPAGSQQ